MFIVFNKDKTSSYLISVGIVAFLFAMPLIIKDKQVYETSATVNEIEENVNKTNETNEVSIQNETDEKNKNINE